jgi:hypothetical protein
MEQLVRFECVFVDGTGDVMKISAEIDKYGKIDVAIQDEFEEEKRTFFIIEDFKDFMGELVIEKIIDIKEYRKELVA